MSDQTWQQQLINNGPMICEKMTKYANRLIMFIDYIPIVGPMYNATHALNLLLIFWRGSGAITGQNEDEERSIQKEKSRQVREKGLTAVVTALIDIFTICLAVGVIAFVCDCLVRIQTWAFVRQALILFIMINILAMTIGAKIITGQLVIHLTRQLEDVNHVGTSMVKSVTITASAIERIVETTETTTNIFVRHCQYYWNCICYYTTLVITFPQRAAIQSFTKVRVTTRQSIQKTKVVIRRQLSPPALINLMTLGISGRIMRHMALQDHMKQHQD